MFVGVHGSKDSMLVLNPQHGFHVGRGFFVLFVFVSIMFFVCYLTFNAAKVANYFGIPKDFEGFNMNLTQVRKKKYHELNFM